MYVCGITPYDATHIGHAATYVAFDLLMRAWRDAGHAVPYVQNVTDVDDPLLERAAATGEDWRDLADRETELFREDMTALRVLPPDALRRGGRVDPARGRPGRAAARARGASTTSTATSTSRCAATRLRRGVRLDAEPMLQLFAERGGDPDRPARSDPLDCLLWQAERPGEPAWDSALRPGPPRLAHRVRGDRAALPRQRLRRPGRRHRPGVPAPRDVRGAGAGRRRQSAFAQAYVHSGMVGLDGEKMSQVARATSSSSPGCAPRASTRWRSGWRCWRTTTAATGSGPTRPAPTRERAARRCGARRSLRPAGPIGRRRCCDAVRDRAGRRPRRPRRAGDRRRLGGGG